jgi:DNA invertase Pin-like site-specific DNA recombinase
LFSLLCLLCSTEGITSRLAAPFAEFETNLRRERQLEGIKAAEACGIYKDRKPSIDPDELCRLRDEKKLGPAAIARRLGIGRANVYRVIGKLTLPA